MLIWFANFCWVYCLLMKSSTIATFSSHPFHLGLRSSMWICTYLLDKNNKIMQSLKMTINNLVSSHFYHLSEVGFDQAEKIHMSSLINFNSLGSVIKQCTHCKWWNYVLDCLPADIHLLKLSLCNFRCMKPTPKKRMTPKSQNSPLDKQHFLLTCEYWRSQPI